MILGTDQGTIITRNGGETWSSWYNQPTGQLYHVSTDNRFPYWVYGAQQDSGAIATPSRGNYRSLNFHDWRPVAAGDENGYIAPDPENPGVIYGGFVTRQDLDNEQTTSHAAIAGKFRGLPTDVDAAADFFSAGSSRAVFRLTGFVQEQ